ncbi:MAG: hypothetical protein ACFFDI_09670 [Promethearchaeota archaeon]
MKRSRLTVLFLIVSYLALLVSYLLIPSGLGLAYMIIANIVKVPLFLIYLLAVYMAFVERSGSGTWNLVPMGHTSARTFSFALAIVDLLLIIVLYVWDFETGFLTVPNLQLMLQDIINILLVVLSAIIVFVGGLVYEDAKTPRII